MRTFWRFLLRKNLPPDSLSSVTFAALGWETQASLRSTLDPPMFVSRRQLTGRESAGGNDVLLDLIRDCSCPVFGQFTGHPLSG